MRYLTLDEVIYLHHQIIEQSGGSKGIRDRGGLDSAVVQPQMTFGGSDLYPDVVQKAAALGYSLICNHPFIDGNKRIGHAAMEVFLMLQGKELNAPVEDQELVILKVAAGEMTREEFTAWVRSNVTDRT